MIGKELSGATTVVQGSVQLESDQLRVTVTLDSGAG